MSPRCRFVVLLALVVVSSVVFRIRANAQALGSGDLLITKGQAILEYTSSGTLVQTINVPAPTGVDGSLRSITVDARGQIQAFNGTFSPYLDTYSLPGGTWTSQTYDGWSTVNNVTYGGVAAYKSYVYVTDDATAYNGGPNGIVRFNLADGSANRYASGIDFINLCIGYDGLLYAIAYDDGLGTPICVYDPDTMDQIRSFHLPLDSWSNDEFRSIGVDANGDIFAIGLGGTINHFDNQGNLINSGSIGTTYPVSMALSVDGRIAVTREDGNVTLTDETLSAFTSFQITNNPNIFTEAPFITFVPPGTNFDLNGDGKADILFRNVISGDLNYWLMNRTQYSGQWGSIMSGIPTQWKVVGTPDFDGDGKPDILWQNQVTGQVVYWIMNGTTFTGTYGTITPAVTPDWQIVGTPDLNRDGHPDILWQNQKTGQVTYWIMKGTTFTGAYGTITPAVTPDWKVVGTPDLDGDGHADIVWQNQNSGAITFWLMKGTTFTGTYGTLWPSLPLEWKVVGTPDLNGDGYADLLFQNERTGEISYWLLTGTQFPATAGTYGTIISGMPLQWQIVNSH